MAASIDLLRVGALAFAVTTLLIPLFAWWSQKVGLVDLPNDRKIHDGPVPLVGGLAVYCGIVAAILLGGFADTQVKLLLLASAGVIALGALDDRLDLHSSHRLLVQIGIATALCSAGVRFHVVGIAAADWTLTILCMVGAMNAFNCLDCADGMAGSAALVAFLGYALTATLNGRPFIAQSATAGAGAIIGFLLFNRPKARVFLGDTGSTLLGLMAAALAMTSSPKPGDALQIPWPAVALLLPFYDLVLVHVRRYRGGIRSIRHLLASTGKDHLPHRLLALGMGPWEAICVVALLSVLATMAACDFSLGSSVVGFVSLSLLGSLLWQIEQPGASRAAQPLIGPSALRSGLRIVILGGGSEAVALIRRLRAAQSSQRVVILGVLQDGLDPPGRALDMIPVLGPLSKLPALVEAQKITHCLLGTSPHSEMGNKIMTFCREQSIAVYREIDALPLLAAEEPVAALA